MVEAGVGLLPAGGGLHELDETAKKVMGNLDKFEYEGGLVTTAKKPEIQTPMPPQWAYPNGWAPLHLMAVEAMERYGYHVDAERIARKWINACLVKFEERGVFLEKYNMVDVGQDPKDGVYPLHVGFGWTNAVFVRFCQKYLRPDEMPYIESKADLPPLTHLVRNPRQTLRRVGVKLTNVPVPKIPKRFT